MFLLCVGCLEATLQSANNTANNTEMKLKHHLRTGITIMSNTNLKIFNNLAVIIRISNQAC